MQRLIVTIDCPVMFDETLEISNAYWYEILKYKIHFVVLLFIYFRFSMMILSGPSEDQNPPGVTTLLHTQGAGNFIRSLFILLLT